MPVTSILTLCLGNICRSPMAEGLLRTRIEAAGLDITVDSAGIGPWHIGDPPDPRTIRTAHRNGIDISMLRGRQISPSDYERFDLILAMDSRNLSDALAQRPQSSRSDIRLFMDYAEGNQADVPDPYYGTEDDFQMLFNLLDRATGRLVRNIHAARG